MIETIIRSNNMKTKTMFTAVIAALTLLLGNCSTPTGGGNNDPVAVTIAAIPGVTAPVTNAFPVTAITETAQYTGTVAWSPAIPGLATGNMSRAVTGGFAASTAYTATITLTAKAGYTLQGVAANFFTVAGTSAPTTNAANSGVVTAVFPATAGGTPSTAAYDITGKTLGEIGSAITGALTNGNVTVTGSLSGMTNVLRLNIPANRTVTWQAAYSGNGQFEISGGGGLVITGTIESSTTGLAVYTTDFNGTITVGTGGRITSNGTGLAITDSAPVIIVEGGTIEAANGYGIEVYNNANPKIFMRSGAVSTNGASYAIALRGNAVLAVSGGNVSATGRTYIVELAGNTRVYVYGSPVIANGGIIRNTGGTGYYTGDNAAKFAGFTLNTNLFASEPPDWPWLNP